MVHAWGTRGWFTLPRLASALLETIGRTRSGRSAGQGCQRRVALVLPPLQARCLVRGVGLAGACCRHFRRQLAQRQMSP